GLVIDIPRNISAENGLLVADWAIDGMGDGVIALGLGGPEIGNPPEKFAEAFARARAAGLPSVPHAGETVGPQSIWGALRALDAQRIGHGVRCLEDAALVAELRERQIPLEVCPTSNVCLGVAPSIAEHPLPRLIDEGLYVTLNSDDPPMFNTSLTGEYLAVARAYGWGAGELERLALNAVRAALLPAAEREALEAQFVAEFARLRAEHLA
ncbi:MAG: adenosine deaminase, partial [Roseiflexaceae bacterium]